MKKKIDADLIYDTIINSAKTKFDYKSFSKGFDEIGKNVAENILFKILVEFASDEEKERIARKLFNQILLAGYKIKIEDLIEFLEDKDDVLELEIFLTQMASSMLEKGNSPIHVLDTINLYIEQPDNNSEKNQDSINLSSISSTNMEYGDLVQNTKKIFVSRLEKIITKDEYEANPVLSKSAYIDVVFTEIMSLGYNFGSIPKAVDDIYEMKSMIQGDSKELRAEILTGVIETSKRYANEIKVFSQFHKSYQQGTDYNILLSDLDKKLQ